ncbi:hypothetical protein E9126_23110 [Salmonella enterica subsp. enterica serovar Goldcoast]|uniref:Uncharacterized protein n=1 Tax=Salmonella enterica subsp. enterica serovar Goldcoast TaxID=260678 RepID=A0A6D2CDM8_SALET|nr:hypothetical protein E9126_23110 [Salmonella enterica subsp. enterica serovar Goldcoast]
MPAFEWVHVQLHQQKGMISLSPPTICNSAPVFNIGLNEQYRYWTPWGINFIEFSRQAAKARTAVFVPDVGQIEWKSAEHKELAELSLIDQIIPKQYHWLLGIPTMWRNNYCNHDQRLALFREWRESNGCG